jgi:hypothetical protein
MTTRDYLHIALGDSAGDTLKDACATLGLPGDVLAISDDLSNGPLHDGRARSAYWRSLGEDFDEMPDDMFAVWHGLHERIAANAQLMPVIWSTDAVSDSVLHRMAVWRLRDFPGGVASVNVTRLTRQCGLGIHKADQLKRAFDEHLQIIDANERRALEQEFVALRDANGGLRLHAQGGGILSVPADRLDHWLLSFVGNDWLRPAWVLGLCIAMSDQHDCIGDYFFERRIFELIRAGKLEVKGDLSDRRQYRIRRPI